MKRKISRFLLKVLMAGILLSAALSLTTCESIPVGAVIQEPELKFLSADLTGITLNGLQLLCKIQVNNPNQFKIPYPETDWSFFINNNSFLKGTVRKGQDIKARSSAIIDLPVNIEYLGIFNSFRSLRGNAQVPYRIATSMKIPIPVLGEKIYNIEYTGQLPLPQQPKVSNPTMSLSTSDATRAELVVSMNLENPNSFPVPAPKITYDYMINRSSFIKGTVENERPLAARATTPVNFRIQVSYTDLIRSFATLITASSVATTLNYSLDFGVPGFNWNDFASAIPFTLPIRR